MEQEFKIENLGYTANNNPLRAIRNGDEFRGLIPAPDWHEEVVRRNATVDGTVGEMEKLIKSCAWQTADLAKVLQGKNIYETCGKIWNFLFSHIKYREDDEGQEQLRTPALSWKLRTSRGIDCDDFSIFASTILYNLNIPHYLRIARYKGKDYFQHVYVIVPGTGKNYYTIDGVLDQYDTEKEPIETKDFLIMNKSNLNGIDVSVLSGIGDDELSEISGILSGIDFGEIDELEGLGRIPTRGQELNAIRNHLIRTRDAVHRYPHIVKQVEDPESFLGMVNYAIKYWDTDKRDEALGILEEQEEKLNYLNGLSGMVDGYEETGLYYGVEGLGGVALLGKVKAKKGFFKKVKQAAKKAGSGIKKIAKKLIRVNPITITARGGMLAAMKTNFLKMAEKLKWGYLTESEARDHGFNAEEWQHAREALNKTEKLFVNVLQGKAENLKKAILTGRAGGLNGIETSEDLGYVVAASAGAAVTTALPFIKKVVGFLKKINYKKLIANVKPIYLKLKKKKADKETESADAQNASDSSGGGDENGDGNDTKEERPSAMPNDEPSSSEPKSPSESGGDSGGGESLNKDSSEADNKEADTKTTDAVETTNPKDNLPTKNEIEVPESSAIRTTESVFDKAKAWVSENKGASALIAGGIIFGIYELTTMGKHKKGLSGASRKGKKKSGKAKNHPPKTIRRSPRKKGKGGRGGKGGKGGAQITL